jgi:hypothetical protein
MLLVYHALSRPHPLTNEHLSRDEMSSKPSERERAHEQLVLVHWSGIRQATEQTPASFAVGAVKRIQRSGPGTWVTQQTGNMGDTLAHALEGHVTSERTDEIYRGLARG